MSRYQIKTHKGFKPFSHVLKKKASNTLLVCFDDDTTLQGTPDHLVSCDGEEFRDLKSLSVGDRVGNKTVSFIKAIEGTVDVFDVVDVQDTHSYFTNGIISHNCLFLGSENTLICGPVLRAFSHVPHLKEYYTGNVAGLRIYENPQEDKNYVLCVDVSEGIGLDYNAFTVIDITDLPYRIVAIYRNNDIPYLLYPDVIHRIATEYNMAYVMVELNDHGAEVAGSLHRDLEYENMLMTSVRGRKGQVLDGGFGGKGRSQLGVKMSPAVKSIGCSMLKELVENQKMSIEDIDIIEELCNFVATKKSWAAAPNKNDDLVMTLVCFSWLTTQPYFKDMLDLDIKKKLYEKNIEQIESELTPFGFWSETDYDDADEKKFVDAEGTVWEVVDEWPTH